MDVLRHWLRMSLPLLGGLGLLVGSAAQAQDPATESLIERLDRLERQNEELRQRLEAGQTPVNLAEGDVTAAQVQKIVGDYLKDVDKKKKADEDAKKKKAAEEGYEVGSDTKMNVKWSNGISAATANGDFKVHVGGRMHFDNGWWTNDADLDPRGFLDGSNFRRGRLRVDGQFWEVFTWTAEYDFAQRNGSVGSLGGTTSTFTDVYVQINQLPVVGTFRAGHFKEPFSLEELTSSRYITFIERALPNALAPQRNDGFQFMNTYGPEENGTWAIGLFRPFTNGGGADFGDGAYSYTGRVTFLPIYEQGGRCLVHVGANYSHAQTDLLPIADDVGDDTRSFSTLPELRAGGPVTSLISTGSPLLDNYDLYGAEFAVVWGPLSFQAEYIGASLLDDGLAGGGLTDDAYIYGYYGFVSYFLTGENRRYSKHSAAFDRVSPNEPFFLVRTGEDACGRTCCGKGAWELAARWSYLNLGDSALTADTRGQLNELTLGVNWYMTSNLRFMFNYLHGWVNGTDLTAVTQSGEYDAVGMRVALDF